MELTLGRPSLHNRSPSIDRLHFPHEDHTTLKMNKIEAYLKSLKDERQKIEAFKRELPLCMQLLSNEIEASWEQLCDCKNERTCRFFEDSSRPTDFMIPLEVNSSHEELNSHESLVGNGTWPPTSSCLRGEVDVVEDQEVISAIASQLYRTRPLERIEKGLQARSSDDVLGRRPGGAFVPFLKDGIRKPSEEAAADTASPSHAHTQDAYQGTYFSASCAEGTAHQEVFPTGAILPTLSDGASHQAINEPYPPAAAVNVGNNGSPSQLSPHRKPRRCWSTELHRKFVNALKQLGGSEAATPKLIRELMQVDGLTNDEIKSHLQKYRLHIKRPNPMTSQLPGADAAQAPKGTPQLVLLGGIWVPPEYDALKQQQGLGHPLYINPLPHLNMDQAPINQGQPLFYHNQYHIPTI